MKFALFPCFWRWVFSSKSAGFLRVCLVLAAPAQGFAQTVTALHNGDWNNPSTWIGGLPTSGNTADIGTFTITVNGNFTVGGLTMGPNSTLNGGGGILNVLNQVTFNPLSANASEHLVSGTLGTIFTLNNLGLANLNAPAGVQVGLTDDGAGTARLNNLSGGAFNLNNAASILGNATSVFSNQAGATLNHTGSGASLVQWTFSNSGTVEVANGSVDLQGPVSQVSGSALNGGTWNVRNSGNLVLSGSPALTILGAGASVTLDGAVSTFAALDGLATVSGSFNVIAGRSFTTSGNFIDDGAVTVSDSNSILQVNGGNLTVGQTGAANLTIANGGNVTSAGGVLGQNNGGTGTALVTGANSLWNVSSGMIAGQDGNGTWMLANGGTAIVSSNGVTAGSGAAGSGSVIVTGAGSSLYVNGGNLTVGQSGAGNVTVSNGGSIIAGAKVLLGENVGGSGALSLNTQGRLEIGGADGLAAGSGNYTFNWGGGTVKITSDFTTSLNATLAPDATSTNLDTNGFNATWSGVISGSDSFAKIGNGTLTFTGNNTYSGLTTVASGNLQVGAGGTSGALGASRVDNFGNLVFDRANDYAYAGNISGTGNLYQEGAGTLILSGNNTYTGETRINGGTLQITDIGAGSTVGFGTLFVTSNGTLTGGGVIGEHVVVAGAVNPGVGNTTDLISVAGGLAFNPGTVVTMDLFGTVRATQYDAFDVGEDILYGGTLNVLLGSGYTPFKGNFFDLFNVGGSGAGAFTVLNLPVLPGALEWDTTSLYTNGRLAVVPEPGVSAALAGFAALGLCLWRRRCKQT